MGTACRLLRTRLSGAIESGCCYSGPELPKSCIRYRYNRIRQPMEGAGMDVSLIRDRVQQLQAKRRVLVHLLERPDLGTLRIDVNQAIEEIDDLLAEVQRTFPEMP